MGVSFSLTGSELGYGNTHNIGDDELPNSVGTVSVGEPVLQIVAGRQFTCALLESGNVRCWGYGLYGELGYGNIDDVGDDELPSSVGIVSISEPVEQLALGERFACALLASGDVLCWGSGGWGQLGYGNFDDIGDDELPSSVGPVPIGETSVEQIATGQRYTCALMESDNIRCWGAGDFGQLGYGDTERIGDDEPASTGGPVSYY